jgi:hypothetical protein
LVALLGPKGLEELKPLIRLAAPRNEAELTEKDAPVVNLDYKKAA